MKEFTFIVITYNQEQYVTEHLESIKYLVQTYGAGMDIDIVVADDKSRDRTVEVVRAWLKANWELFRNVLVIDREENVGTIRNIQTAIEATKTEQFKFLAGDDKYNGANIFELQKKDTMVITPVEPFGEPQEKDLAVFREFYRLILRHNTKEKLAALLQYASVVPAPGVFLDSNIYRQEGLWEFLKQFRLIEDYPTWSYLLRNKGIKLNVEVLTTPYIYYRMSSGVSTGSKSSVFEKEEQKVIEVLRVKTKRYPKYINIYKYIYLLKRLSARHLNSEDAMKIDEIYKAK